MASEVDVQITDRAIITALNTPGGAVFEWRDETMQQIRDHAFANSPVNDPMSAEHRGGEVGTYKASWSTSRAGSGAHTVRATIANSADHADIVEYGRSSSTRYQRFTWAAVDGGQVEVAGGRRFKKKPGTVLVLSKTGFRFGDLVLHNAVNAVMPAATGGTFTRIIPDI